MDYRNLQEAFDLVKEFYDHAWNTLIISTSIIFGLVGGLWPIILNRIQSRTSRSRIKNLEAEYKKQSKSLEALIVDSKTAMGGVYLHQGNLQYKEYENLQEKSGIEPMDIYLSFLKSLDYFLDTSITRNIDTAYEQLERVSSAFKLKREHRRYREFKHVYNLVNEKLRKNKDDELYSDIILYLRDVLYVIELNELPSQNGDNTNLNAHLP
jgi:hypothetical protein